jgi:N6-adenosine-specific RNA methylase IME4/ParB-like chromosome segregation protein Spo0J
MLEKISEIVLNDNRRKVDAAKVKELAESIKQLGLINPITINSNNVLIAGNHRLEAFKLLGKDEIEVSVLDLNNLLAELAEIDENLVRNELHWTDADKQIARRKAIYLELYPETKTGGDRKSDKIKIQTLDSDNKTFVQDTADKTNKSKSSISQSVKRGNEITEEEAEVLKTIDAPKSYGDILIKQTTETRAKVIDALKVESKPVEIIIQEIKKEEKKAERIELIEQQIEDIEQGLLPELEGLFDVVSVDPPWPYEGENKNITSFDAIGRRVANPYPEMSIEQIKKIEMPLMNDSVVLLWTTHKFLPDAFEILKEWNLEYKATLVWNKEKIGMGAWFRMQCEFCLVAIKGKPYWNNTTFRDILNEPRREHSRKPDSFFEMIEQITLGRRLEYFSREKRNGWEVFGNDINKF